MITYTLTRRRIYSLKHIPSSPLINYNKLTGIRSLAQQPIANKKTRHFSGTFTYHLSAIFRIARIKSHLLKNGFTRQERKRQYLLVLFTENTFLGVIKNSGMTDAPKRIKLFKKLNNLPTTELTRVVYTICHEQFFSQLRMSSSIIYGFSNIDHGHIKKFFVAC